MGDMVVAIIFEEPDTGDPRKDAPRLAEIIERAQKLGRDIPNVNIQLTRGDAAATIRFFAENGELPVGVPEAEEDESNLVRHARKELNLIGEEDAMVAGYLAMINIFSKMGHSGGSASVFIPVLNALLRFQNLSPLTDDPDEWMQINPSDEEIVCYQSRRNPEAFSEDGGKSYYLLSEGGTFGKPSELHKTEHKEKE